MLLSHGSWRRRECCVVRCAGGDGTSEDPRTMGEARWESGRWRWALWAAVPALGLWVWEFVAEIDRGFREDGVFEIAQVVVWGLSCVSAVVVATRITHGPSRWGTVLLGVFAFFAMLRELDAHIALNPQRLGAWGVRYRIDWWLDGSVPVMIKAVWVAIAACVAAVVGYSVWRARQPMRWDLARLRLLAGAGVMLFVGFVCDDLLRGRVPIEIAQVIEETAEMIGALLFLAAVLAPESASDRGLQGQREPA